MHTRFPMTLMAYFALACGTDSHPLDATTKFVGRWTYQPGSTINAECANEPSQSLDLTRVPPSNQPGYFTLSAATGDGVHEVDARGCQYDWAVAGDIATARPGQTCPTFPDGRGGNRVVRIQSATKTTKDGASMAVDAHFTTDTPESCSIHVQGNATKS